MQGGKSGTWCGRPVSSLLRKNQQEADTAAAAEHGFLPPDREKVGAHSRLIGIFVDWPRRHGGPAWARPCRCAYLAAGAAAVRYLLVVIYL
jgi:hypothetical protein